MGRPEVIETVAAHSVDPSAPELVDPSVQIRLIGCGGFVFV